MELPAPRPPSRFHVNSAKAGLSLLRSASLHFILTESQFKEKGKKRSKMPHLPLGLVCISCQTLALGWGASAAWGPLPQL